MKLQKTIYSLLLAATAIFASCSDEFFDTAPADDLTGKETYASTANIDALVNGTLRYLMESSTSQDNPGYAAIILSQEVMGEDAIARDGVYGFRDSYPFRDPYDNTTRRALFFWSFQYKVIDNCNNIIAYVDQASGPEADKKYLKGQALALRAFVYLNLVGQYQFTYAKDKTAKAVPIYTEPTSPASQPKPRATVEEVYNQVISDLTAAETLLQGFKRVVKNRPDVNVVKGLFARAYLNTGKWDLAAAKATEARVGYAIMEPGQYLQGFNDVSNVEWIWGHPQKADQNLGGASYFAYIDVTPATGYRSIMPDPFFRKLFLDQDIRKSLFELVTTPADPMYRWYKYKKFVDKTDRSGNIVLMRSSEMALIQAEGKARLNDLSGAITALNDVRIKRNLPAIVDGTLDQPALIEEILLERRRELWGEGFRLPDILRLQRSVVRNETTDTFKSGTSDVVIKGHYIRVFPDNSQFVPNSPYYLFSIPINEINTNPNL
ncbi:RagB/SusD family nutrient uptake outer membrane protein [Pedobacter metabolipauper]|uniref:SusD-like starch-binding protein associating with outer membrane n=1 Tax=Pedobacter metabolipauper TaxID=425513 RepID=A0A4R6STZ1_9SPHI|nr:RagB/SusD family nutrient uptake outer membrane protein [Pedobacter metabolipauper]TDQ08240.1 SusD-like starch-binding protein associating with outer membrane [Pedobacter metabolipauper]